MISDPWNPSIEDIREWAYSPNALAPCQDWDLALSWAGHEREYIEFASDDYCPNQDYFLHVLYFMVGDAVRNEFNTVAKPIVVGFTQLGRHSLNENVRLWFARATQLLNNPSEFIYSDWCGGELAKNKT